MTLGSGLEWLMLLSIHSLVCRINIMQPMSLVNRFLIHHAVLPKKNPVILFSALDMGNPGL